jgi:hypothetical protein
LNEHSISERTLWVDIISANVNDGTIKIIIVVIKQLTNQPTVQINQRYNQPTNNQATIQRVSR